MSAILGILEYDIEVMMLLPRWFYDVEETLIYSKVEKNMKNLSIHYNLIKLRCHTGVVQDSNIRYDNYMLQNKCFGSYSEILKN